MNPADTEQLGGLLVEWRRLESELSELSVVVREKRKRVKSLRDGIIVLMKKNKLGRLNFSAGLLTTREKSTKAPITKKFVSESLAEFFNGDLAMAERCAAFLESRRPLRVQENLQLDPHQ